jgi:hypothetical protein
MSFYYVLAENLFYSFYQELYYIRYTLGRSQWRSGQLEHWDWGFESHSRHGCLCAFILFVLLCVQAATLRRADPPSTEFYRLCIGLRNWKSCKGPKGCRATVREIISWGKFWPNNYYLRFKFQFIYKVSAFIYSYYPLSKVSSYNWTSGLRTSGQFGNSTTMQNLTALI